MSTTKRKHFTLPLKEKISIIERIDKGESLNILALEYGVGRATIYGIHKNREKIQEYATVSDCSLDKRLTLKKAKHPEVEDALYMWYLKEKHNRLITGEILAQKAKCFYQEMTGKSDFNASKGWRDRFKLRYGIRQKRSTEAEMSSAQAGTIDKKKKCRANLNIEENKCNDTLYDTIKEKFLQRVTDLNLSPSQVYNAVASSLFWKVPHKLNEDKSLDDQVVRERFAICPCTNASAQHCLKLLIIGRRPKTRSLKNIELPVHYYVQKYTSMSRELVKKWFDDCFVPDVKKWLKDQGLPQKALLILPNTDNLFEEELSTDDKSIVTMLIPANCIEILPMDQISQYIKKDYKKKMMSDVLYTKEYLDRILKSFNMKYMVYSLNDSWRELHVSKIFNAWASFWDDISKLDLPKFESEEIKEENDIPELIESVSNRTKASIEEVQKWYEGVDEKQQFISEEETVSDCSRGEDPISEEDAVKSFDTCMQWAEENNCSNEEILLLNKMRDKAFQKLIEQNDEEYILPNPNDYLKVHLDD